MDKKTIVIPNKFVKAVGLGVVIGVLIVFFTHFFGEWSARPPEKNSASFGDVFYSNSTKVSLYFLNCPFGDLHIYKGNGATFGDVTGGHFSNVKFGAIISATFDGHWKSIFIIGLIAATIIYLMDKIKLKISKE